MAIERNSPEWHARVEAAIEKKYGSNPAGGNTASNTGGTSAPSPNKTDAEVNRAKRRGYEDTKAYYQQQEAYNDWLKYQRTAEGLSKNLDEAMQNSSMSHKWLDYYAEHPEAYANAQAAELSRKFYDQASQEKAYKDAVKAYDFFSHATSTGSSLEEVEAAKKRFDDALKAEEQALKYVEHLDSDATQKQLSQATAEREAAAKALEPYGIVVNGTQIDDRYFYDNYFAHAMESASKGEYNPLVMDFLIGNDAYYNISSNKALMSATDEEKNLLGYLINQDKFYGTNRASVYARYLEGLVSRRAGESKAQEIMSRETDVGKVIGYGTQAFKGGYQKAISDLSKTFGGTRVDGSSEYASEILRQNLADEGKNTGAFFFDAAQSIGAMVPGLAAGAVTMNPAFGAVIFGTTAGSSGYQDKLEAGWSQSDAAAYGVLNGISESALQYALGGIGLVGGLPNIINKAMGSIPRPMLRAFTAASLRGGSEFLEEFLQTYIEPAIVSAVQDSGYEVPGFRDALRNGLLGVVASLGLGGGAFVRDVRNAKAENASVEKLAAEAEENLRGISDKRRATYDGKAPIKVSAKPATEIASIIEARYGNIPNARRPSIDAVEVGNYRYIIRNGKDGTYEIISRTKKPAPTVQPDTVEALTGIPATQGQETVLDAGTLDGIVSAVTSRVDLNNAAIRVLNDEAIAAEVERRTGIKPNSKKTARAAINELITKSDIEARFAEAVDSGSPDVISQVLYDIATTPQALEVLNKYYGNIPGSEDGNVQFVRDIVAQLNGTPTTQTTPAAKENATTADVETEAEAVRRVIDETAGIAPVAEQATESQNKPVEAQGVQVTPEATQEAEQAASERLNQQGLRQANADGTMNTENIDGGDKNGQREIRSYSDARANEEVQDAAHARGTGKDKGTQGSLFAATHSGTERGVFGEERGTQSKVSGKAAQALGRNEAFGANRRPAEKVINGLGLARPTHESVIRRAGGKEVYEVVSFNDDIQYIADWFKENDIPAFFFYGESEDIFGGDIAYYSPSENAVFLDVSDPDLMRSALHEGIHRKLDVSGVNFVEEYFELQRHLSDDVMDALDAEEASIAESYRFTEEEYIPEAIGDYIRFGESEEDAFYDAYEDYWEALTHEFMAFVGSADLHTSFSPEAIQLIKQVRFLLVDSGVVPETFFDLELTYVEKVKDQLESHYNSTEKDNYSTYEESGIEYAEEPQQPNYPSHKPSDDAELTALQMDEEREAANSDMQLQQQMYETKQQVNSSGQYIQQQRDAEQAAQRQREQEGLPKYDIAHEYGETAATKLSSVSEKLGKLISTQTVYQKDADGNTRAVNVSKLVAGKDILNLAISVAEGQASITDLDVAYRQLSENGGNAKYLYSPKIAAAINAAANDVSAENNTQYVQITQEQKAKDITKAFELLAKRAEIAAAIKPEVAKFNTEIQTGNSGISKAAFSWFGEWLATPDLIWKALSGFKAEGKTIGYKRADQALECNVTEKSMRSAGYAFLADVIKHSDYKKFAQNELMSGFKVKNGSGESIELTAQEAVTALHSLRSIREQTKDFSNGIPRSIFVERDGAPVYIFKAGSKYKNSKNELISLEKEIEKHVTGIAKYYSDSIDKMFSYYRPKFIGAITATTGVEPDGVGFEKYFPLFYQIEGTTNFSIDEAMKSRFDSLGFAQERTGPGEELRISPVAEIAENYIEQVSHYIAWSEFSAELDMMAENIDGQGSFLSSVENTYSKSAADAVREYIKFVGGYNKLSQSDMSKFSNKLLGNYAAAVITGKPTVTLSQLSSVFASGGILKPTSIWKAGAIFPTQRKHVNADDPIIQNRQRQGINDSTVSEIMNNADNKIKKIIEAIPGGKIYYNLVGIADSYTTKQIYAASYFDVQTDYPHLEKGNPKLFDALVADKFAEAVMFSQSDSDKVNNARLYRDDRFWVRAVGLFTQQPNKQLNMLVTALGEYNAASKTTKNDAGKKLAQTIAGQVSASLGYGILRTVANLVEHKNYGLEDDDDEGESRLDEIALYAFGQSASAFVGMIPFVDDLASKLVYGLSKGKYGNNFDVQLTGISEVTEFVKNSADFISTAAKGERIKSNLVKELAFSLSTFFGAPVQGAYDYYNAIALWARDVNNYIENGGKFKVSGDYSITKVKDRERGAKDKIDKRITGMSGLKLKLTDIPDERKAVQDAIRALYEETGTMSSLPPEFDGEINDDIRLTGKEKQKYQDNLLDTFYENFEAVYNTPLYKDADTATKQAIVDSLKKFSTDQAKQEYYKAIGIEHESKYKTLLEGKVIPGKDEEGNPKPDIPALSEEKIPEYLAYTAAYTKAIGSRDYDAIDALIDDYSKLGNAEKMFFDDSYGTALVEASQKGVGSEDYFAIEDAIDKAAVELDLNSTSAEAKRKGFADANVSDEVKDAMASEYMSKTRYGVYSAARQSQKDIDYALGLYDLLDANGNEYLTQDELRSVYQKDRSAKDMLEVIWGQIWDSTPNIY